MPFSGGPDSRTVGDGWWRHRAPSWPRSCWQLITPTCRNLTCSIPNTIWTEYDLVRRHLGPAGRVPNDCALMTFSSLIHMDLDLKSFEQVVPDRTVIDCGRADCVSQLRDGRCYYYVRSAASYFHENGIPPACAAADANGTTADTDACLNPPTIAFEESVQLDVVEKRPIDLDRTFPDAGFPARGYPKNAAAGLFRVRAKDHRQQDG